MKNSINFKDLFTQIIKESMEKSLSTSHSLKKETNEKDIEVLKKNKISIDNITEKINSIRSGRSVKDEKVFSKLSEYFNSLSDSEKTALFVFLKALSQIFSTEIDSKDIIDPSDKPPSLKIKRTDPVQGDASKNNQKVKSLTVNKVSAEKTEKMNPIKPKEKKWKEILTH